MKDQPAVSVVTPVYNGEKYLVECIESVLHQTFENFEYVIVNNCSKDRTLEIAQSYARKDSRIRVHDNVEFLDLTANHNHAWRQISPHTRYGKFVCADDMIMPDCLKQMVDFADQHPSVGIIGAYQQSLKRILWQGFQYPKAVFSGREICRQIFLGSDPNFGFGTPTSLLFRADIIRSNKEFFPNSSVHADTSACFSYLRNCDYGFVYNVLSYERIHEEQASFTSLQLNRYLASVLNDLLHYGPSYLSEGEYEQCLKSCIEDYHRYLASSYLSGQREEKFWNYHRNILKELGFPLKQSQLAGATMKLIWRATVNPALAISRVRKPAGRKPNQASPAPAPAEHVSAPQATPTNGI